VRRELRSLANSGVANSLIAGSLDNRLSAIWKYAEPIFAEFLEEDLKNYQNQKKKEKDQKKIEEETRQ
jgi:lambda repressor-like predicted transcriptional regulator